MDFPELTEEEKAALNGTLPEEPEEEEEQESPEEEKVDEPAEDKKAPVEEKPEEKLDNATAARLRWEAAEAKRRLAEKDAELAALKNPPKPIPAKEENYEGHIEGRLETNEERLARLERAEEKRQNETREQQELNGAINELQGYEQQFAQQAPDYSAAADHVKRMIATSIKFLEPDIAPEALAKRTVRKYLEHAAIALRDGKHPGSAIYEIAQSTGYRKAEVKEEPKERNNFAKIAENKKKTSGMAGAGGSGGQPETTAEYATKMPISEFSRLSPNELDRLMYPS